MGTCVKFNPPTGRDTVMKGGVSTSISTRHQCITAMREYEHKCLEELRLEDYLSKRVASVKLISPTDTTSQKGILASNPTTAFASPKALTKRTASMASFSFSCNNQNPTTTTSEFSNPITFTFTNPIASTAAISNPTTTAFTFSNPTTTALTTSATTSTTTGFSFLNTTATLNPNPFVFSIPNFGSALETSGSSDSSTRGVRRVRPPTIETQLKQLEFNFKPFQFKIKDPPVDASTQTEEDLRVGKFLRGLKDMLLSSKHSDFVLNVKGKEFRVHKIILEAHSPVFAAMMEHDTKERATGIANIDDFEPLTITNFLDFLYTGKVENLNSDSVIDLYEVADKYQVTELIDLCVEYMIKNISVENFCDILTLSLRHHIRNLTEVATEFFLGNSKEIAVTVKWSAFLAQNPVAGNELFLKVLNLEDK